MATRTTQCTLLSIVLNPTPKQWEALRKTWPILDGVPDDELMKNLVECRKEFCDVRFI